MSNVAHDIEQIEAIVQQVIDDKWGLKFTKGRYDYDLELRERSIRVEEELKHQRELMTEGFKQMEKRFEQVDKRFEAMQLEMNRRFEQVDKRFEQVDKRFEQQHQEIMDIHQEIKLLMRWGFGALIGIGGLIIAILRLIL